MLANNSSLILGSAPSQGFLVENSMVIVLTLVALAILFTIYRFAKVRNVKNSETHTQHTFNAKQSSYGQSRDIFISYRRDDSADIAGRLFDTLSTKFSSSRVYKDVDSTLLGYDFADQIEEHLASCRIALIVIGPDWLGINSGKRRIDDEDDFVRLEVRHLLTRQVPVIPIFVRGASMPDRATLPNDIKDLARRNGISLRADPDFHNDAARLVRSIEELLS